MANLARPVPLPGAGDQLLRIHRHHTEGAALVRARRKPTDFFFAGIWRPWTGTRGTKANPVEGEHLLYSFLTCEANEVVKPIHAKAMPVLLTTEDEAAQWLTAPVEEALDLQRPLPADHMTIVAKGERKDEAA